MSDMDQTTRAMLAEAAELLRDSHCTLTSATARQGWHVRRQRVLDMVAQATATRVPRYVVTATDDGRPAVVNTSGRHVAALAPTVDAAAAIADALNASDRLEDTLHDVDTACARMVAGE